MSDPVNLSSRQSSNLLGSQWRDEHGNHFRVYGVSHGPDGITLRLAYVPPTGRAITLEQLKATHVQTGEGIELAS